MQNYGTLFCLLASVVYVVFVDVWNIFPYFFAINKDYLLKYGALFWDSSLCAEYTSFVDRFLFKKPGFFDGFLFKKPLQYLYLEYFTVFIYSIWSIFPYFYSAGNTRALK